MSPMERATQFVARVPARVTHVGAALVLAAGLGAVGLSAVAAEPRITASVGGMLTPGVYGRIDISNGPPPLLYPQPVLIRPPVVAVPMEPLYLYVPPGHAKNWAKHCARYGACDRQVYFVEEARWPGRADRRMPPPMVHERNEWRGDPGGDRWGRDDRWHDRGEPGERGRGHGRGHRD